MPKLNQSRNRGTWDTLKLAPWELTKMVIAGRARVVGRDKFHRNIYELTEVKDAKMASANNQKAPGTPG